MPEDAERCTLTQIMLGELYRPRGLALETAQAVLEDKNPYACNVALGCLNNCSYCYVSKVRRGNKEFRLPKKPPKELVEKQLTKLKDCRSVFLSFLTEPFLKQCRKNTEELADYLTDRGITVATLSKIDSLNIDSRHGMTIISLDEEFHRRFEPNTVLPKHRLEILEMLKGWHEYVWVSMEPYPPSTIYKQNFEDFLEQLSFVDLIVFGKWNYDKRATSPEAINDYRQNIRILRHFCEENYIDLHIKSDTLKLVGQSA